MSEPPASVAPTSPVIAEPAPLPGSARRLCDRCLGRRIIGAAGVEPQREAARLQRPWLEVAEKDCPVCEGAFADAAQWLEAALAAAQPYSFATFQVGTKFPGPCEGLEREISAAMGREKVGENLRTEANRWLAGAIAKATGTATSPEGRPELVLEVDTRYWTAKAEANAVFVKGRYNKLRRDIPQTHWPCRRCTGKGCWECNDTGVTYAESVEDSIGEPAEPVFGATGHSFHGAGREDIDALMLGTGRPFIVELTNPRRRTADLGELTDRINAITSTSGVAVRDLRMAAPDEVAEIKEGEYGKEYLAHCLAQGPVTRSQVQAVVAQLSGTTLEQRTPDRVSHRRADLVRRRRLHRVALEEMADDPGERFSLRVHAESGTYIKEMVSGDEGRTTPSFASVAGLPTKVEFLDVIAILDDRPKEPRSSNASAAALPSPAGGA
ncbi:MAG TPA: tRNA pseudouridine(54/55) synthase Pus10 [Candidatus Thermoplasmatota archaeon]|nr:tRNA pseudouridine(54/55) synthase Pus10 [Candidatus Thermoplasmatota archaeon]